MNSSTDMYMAPEGILEAPVPMDIQSLKYIPISKVHFEILQAISLFWPNLDLVKKDIITRSLM